MGMHKLVPSVLPSDKKLSLTDTAMETGSEMILNPMRRWNHPLSAQLLLLYVIHSWKRMDSIKRSISFLLF